MNKSNPEIWMITFPIPGAFAPTGLLGASLQSSVWIYFFWHFGSAAAVLLYACLKNGDRPNGGDDASIRSAIGWSVAIVLGLVGGREKA